MSRRPSTSSISETMAEQMVEHIWFEMTTFRVEITAMVIKMKVEIMAMVIKMMIEMMAMVAMMFVEMNEKEKIEFPIVMMINGVKTERGNEDTMTDETVETKNEMIIEKVAKKMVEKVTEEIKEMSST